MRSRRAVSRRADLMRRWSVKAHPSRMASTWRALHEFMPRQPMLFATALTTDVSADALAEAGVAEVLSRPLVSSEVAAALARCLRPPGILRT